MTICRGTCQGRTPVHRALYLAGVTKTEQLNKFAHFQEFIAKHELLQDGFIGSYVSEQHERKLTKESAG